MHPLRRGRACVVLTLVREDGQRSYYLAEPDAALDIALQLVASVMHLRDMEDAP